ncbi:MAG TPA: serine/threonine-protein kinase [Actinomycetota bacterium]
MAGRDASDLPFGSVLGRYRIEALLGRGGMSSVYLAEELGLGRRVALKVLSPELSTSETFRRRFVREARLAASLDHPHVIPIFEAGEAEGFPFIAMRYVEGQDLRDLIAKERPLALDRALDIARQVADALDAAHGRHLFTAT